MFGALASCMLSAPAHAVATDAMIEGAKLCTRELPYYERSFGIPAHLLSAIASTESGRYHKGLKIALPWPWTINAEGKGYYFDSKEEAIAAANRLRARGVKSMDVGCMQVNLHHHSHAFRDLEEAFEPRTNVAYAASFLRSLFNEQGDWKQAAASYHSRTPSFGSRYVSRVYDRWYYIIDRIRGARVGAEHQTAAAPVQSAPYGAVSAVQPRSESAGEVKTASLAQPRMLPDTAPAAAPAFAPQAAAAPAKRIKNASRASQKAYQPVSMKIIKVRNAEEGGIERQNGVNVSRPPVTLATIAPASAQTEVAVPVPAPAYASQGSASPRFIFKD